MHAVAPSVLSRSRPACVALIIYFTVMYGREADIHPARAFHFVARILVPPLFKEVTNLLKQLNQFEQDVIYMFKHLMKKNQQYRQNE